MKQGLVKCWVGCRPNPFPAELTHTHHKLPRAAGGTDHPNNLVNICPVCHNAVDRGANYLCKGQAGGALSMVEQYLSDNLDAQRKLMMLINTQAQAWKQPGQLDTRRVTLNLDRTTYNHLKLLASTVRHQTKTGRIKTIGVTAYMENILKSHVANMASQGLVALGGQE